jgi:hypothetical protein
MKNYIANCGEQYEHLNPFAFKNDNILFFLYVAFYVFPVILSNANVVIAVT